MTDEAVRIVEKENDPSLKHKLSLKIASSLFRADKGSSIEEKLLHFQSFVPSFFRRLSTRIDVRMKRLERALQVLEKLPLMIGDIIELIDDEILLESINESLCSSIGKIDMEIGRHLTDIAQSNSQIQAIQETLILSQTRSIFLLLPHQHDAMMR